MNDLNGKNALIIGGSKNIGRAVAVELAKRGADVAISYRSDRSAAAACVSSIEDHGRRGLAVEGDITDPTVVARLEDEIHQFGGADILVLSAAIRSQSSILAMRREQLTEILELAVHSAVCCLQAFVPGMIERGWGRVIAIGGAHQSGWRFPNRAPGYAGKAALAELLLGLAAEVGDRGVTTNIVVPGVIGTEAPDPIQATKRELGARLPIPRTGTVDDVAAACAFLASPRAGYITGEMLRVDGGAHLGHAVPSSTGQQ